MQLGSSFRRLPPVTKKLLIINLIIWFAIQFLPADKLTKLYDLCALHYPMADIFNPAQLVTYMFVHADFFHLFFNMFALFMFGMVIERVLGSKRFLFYYLSCGIGAALIQTGIFAVMISNYASALPDGAVSLIAANDIGELNALLAAEADPIHFLDIRAAIQEIFELMYIPVIGASGAIFGILLAFGFLFPRQPLYLMFLPIPIQARWFVIIYGVIELAQGIGMRAGDNVAHFAHLGGMVFGLLMLLYWKKKGIINVSKF